MRSRVFSFQLVFAVAPLLEMISYIDVAITLSRSNIYIILLLFTYFGMTEVMTDILRRGWMFLNTVDVGISLTLGRLRFAGWFLSRASVVAFGHPSPDVTMLCWSIYIIYNYVFWSCLAPPAEVMPV